MVDKRAAPNRENECIAIRHTCQSSFLPCVTYSLTSCASANNSLLNNKIFITSAALQCL
jgi:hypothetical protein